jgi:hypothetical protein
MHPEWTDRTASYAIFDCDPYVSYAKSKLQTRQPERRDQASMPFATAATK